jgi:photosystem II stability/assembly factor-like uncharacterized protein
MSLRTSALRPALGVAIASAALLFLGAATPLPPSLIAGLRWRNVGSLRGGRVAAVTGAIGQPGVFYAGYPAAGVWKTVNAGITWEPIFDSIRGVSSVGAVEVAPSDPDVVYVGMGDMITGGAINEGDGVYKSTDAGRTWRHLGLDATKQIPSILVDPKDPDLVLVAAQGNVHLRSADRGVYRSTDGGKSWTKTLYVDDTTGIQKIARAYDQPGVIFATTVKHFTEPGPPQGGAGGFGGRGRAEGASNTRIFKSTDEGLTWHEITGGGLPRLDGRTSIAVAMNTNAQRVYLVGNFGLWRSDDGGATWRQMDAEDRRVGNGQGGYNCGVYVDPKDPDVVYTINTSSYVSRDGGNTFTGFKGAPGGDDPQQMWIDPTDGQRIFLGMDQGATVSLDGGRTWSTWYNQSTDQVYHVSADNSTPYWIYAPQQDAGAVRVRDRGNFGEITPLDWSPVGTWEWGTVVADPLDPNVVYGSGSGVLKITYPSEQIINVGPNLDPNAHLRTSFSMPLIWAPWDQHELLAGFQYVMATTDGGVHWRKLSPDLGYPRGARIPSDSEAALPPRPGAVRGGAIESMSASTAAPGIIWVGTSNGLVKMTRDGGKTWSDVSIPDTPDSTFATISSVDASHTTPGEAYVAVDVHRLGDYAPHLYRTRDFGKTWTAIDNGLPTDQVSGSFTRFVRSDTRKAGLLFAGTESGMYVSFDDGDDWQSLQLNLPNTSFRDGVIKGNDLVVGTYGRGIWVLDDISPLRQMAEGTGSEAVHLFRPADATRYHRNVNQDTPFPPEVPHSDNPPDGATIYYYLADRPSGDISLDVLDAGGAVVRHLSSAPIAPVEEAAKPPHPNFWVARPEPMPAEAGTNRLVWDLRVDAPKAFRHSFEINANPGLTPASPEGPLVAPGRYTLRLTVDGRSYTSSLVVKDDPRSPASASAVAAQHALQMELVAGADASWDGYQRAAALRGAIDTLLKGNPSDTIAAAAKALDARLEAVGGNLAGGFRRGGRGGPAVADFVGLNGTFARLINGQDLADMAPTPAMNGAWGAACVDLAKTTDSLASALAALKPLNALLAAAHLNAIAAPGAAPAHVACPAAAKGRSRAERARSNAEDENDDPDNPDAVLNGGGTSDDSD